jgi:hypothetical protein
LAYVVEEVSIEDRKKILADMASDPVRRNAVARWRRFSDPENPLHRLRWAIDRESNSYLFRSESFARELDDGYHFFHVGTPYEIGMRYMPGVSGRRRAGVYPFAPATGPKNPSEGFKAALTSAFGVFGLYGYGDLDSLGAPGCGVVPVFGE